MRVEHSSINNNEEKSIDILVYRTEVYVMSLIQTKSVSSIYFIGEIDVCEANQVDSDLLSDKQIEFNKQFIFSNL